MKQAKAAWLSTVLVVAGWTFFLLPFAKAQTADTILYNGKVLTVDKNFSTAEAVAVTGNKITAVGTNDQVLKQAGPKTLKIDVKGRNIIPGLIDTHLHIESAGPYTVKPPDNELRSYELDWSAVTTKEDVLNQLRDLMQKYHPPAGEWITFNDSHADTPAKLKILFDSLTADDLSTATPSNPAIFTEGIPAENGFLINKMALDIVMKEHGDFLKKYGRFWLGPNGQPDGHLEPPATRLILNVYAPRWKPEQMADGIEKQLQELNAQGHTTISTKARANEVAAYKLLEKSGRQTVRLAYGVGFDQFGSITDPAKDLRKYHNMTGTGDDMDWVNSEAPTSVDGASTRACTNLKRGQAFGPLDGWWPMGQCHTDSEYNGGGGPGRSQRVSGNYFRDYVMAMGEYGLRLANDHVAGDRSVSNLLSMMDQVQKQYGRNATKDWAFDHCVLVNPADFERAGRLGAMFSCEPKYIEDLAPDIAASYGDEAANTFMVPVKSLLKAGARVAYGADRDTYCWIDLQIYMTRKDKKGRVWGPQEALDKETTLRTATSYAAAYVLKSDELGSIEPGKLADLVVLDKDYMTIPAEELHTMQPQLTMMDGRIVFVYTDFASENNLHPDGAVVSTYKDLRARRPKGRPYVIAGTSGG